MIGCSIFQQRDYVWFDYNSKKSAYIHTTFYDDGTDRTFRLVSHFNDVSAFSDVINMLCV